MAETGYRPSAMPTLTRAPAVATSRGSDEDGLGFVLITVIVLCGFVALAAAQVAYFLNKPSPGAKVHIVPFADPVPHEDPDDRPAHQGFLLR